MSRVVTQHSVRHYGVQAILSQVAAACTAQAFEEVEDNSEKSEIEQTFDCAKAVALNELAALLHAAESQYSRRIQAANIKRHDMEDERIEQAKVASLDLTPIDDRILRWLNSADEMPAGGRLENGIDGWQWVPSDY